MLYTVDIFHFGPVDAVMNIESVLFSLDMTSGDMESNIT